MKRIVFLNRFFYPDHSATSQILGDLAFHLAGRGNDVRVITSRQRYDDPQAQLPEADTVSGVAIHRVSATQFGRSALLGRGVDYLSFYGAMLRHALTPDTDSEVAEALLRYFVRRREPSEVNRDKTDLIATFLYRHPRVHGQWQQRSAE